MVILPRVDRAMSEFFQLITLTAQLILKIPIREFKRRGAESAEEVLLKELCDSAFKTSTRNLKFSHRAAEITEAESVLLRGVLHSNWIATIVARWR